MRRLMVALMFSVVALPAGAETLEERAAPCLACHGQRGAVRDGEYAVARRAAAALRADPAVHVS